MAHALVKLEVSQKQAYIFSSNKLKDNVLNSAVIAWIMSPEYFAQTVTVNGKSELFDLKKNLVYSGGGHIVLDFEEKENAVDFVRIVTFQIHKDYPEIEVFAKILEYSENEGKKANSMIDKLVELSKELESKKSARLSAFHQGTFGIEKIDSTTLKPILKSVDGKKYDGQKMPKTELEIEGDLSPAGYNLVNKFEDLGGSHGESSFIAVVHIDGNAMGARVKTIYDGGKSDKRAKWDKFKDKLKSFSDSIDNDFKGAYKDMVQIVQENLEDGRFADLDLKGNNFPVRRIITAGDDICFVTDGRIGIECAVAFINALSKKRNKQDKTGYSACAGVAIVHQKYPFYQAYDLAEKLCSNAKKFGASISDKGEISAIDWHIEYGEMKDTLDEIRDQYNTVDNYRLELRPYVVMPEKSKDKEKIRQYCYFKKLMNDMRKTKFFSSRSKMKEFRSVLKQGNTAVDAFVKFNKMEEISKTVLQVYTEKEIKEILNQGGLKGSWFDSGKDGVKRSLLFDVLEAADTYIAFK